MAAARADLQKLENDCFYQPVHARNVGLVRKLLDVALPVAYGDDFYAALPGTPSDFTKMVYYKDIFVGVVGCRLEPAAEGSGAGKRLYVMVLAVLAPYRDRGLGSLLLRQVVDAVEGGKVKGAEDVCEMYCHVWQENKGAQRLYERFGFVADKELVMNYYKRLENPHAVVLRRAVIRAAGGGGGS